MFSLTDHDSVAGLNDAERISAEAGIGFVPGIELSSTSQHDGIDVHMLGYFIDFRSPALVEYLEYFKIERVKRAERIVVKLNKLGLPLTMDAVLESAGCGVVARPHVANALVRAGLVGSYSIAFQKYLGDTGPAFEAKWKFPIPEAIELIHHAGGISVAAHPGLLSEEVLRETIEAGIDGIEVIHPSHSPAQREDFQAIANEYFLESTGGSDFHGGPRSDEWSLGRFTIPDAQVETLRAHAAQIAHSTRKNA
jgi:hypothetical protein